MQRNQFPLPMILRCTSVLFVIIYCLCLVPAALAVESLCAEVKLEIKQELTLERQAFDAHMQINNGLSGISLENVRVDVLFEDADNNPVVASFDPDADPEVTGAQFFISVDTMENIDDVDGQGQVAPSTSADIHWLIIPVPGSADGLPQGKLYYVGARLSYTIGGEENVTEVTPDYIYVKPLPNLVLDYFLTREVYGDDAFTAETEPSEPFTLGLRVRNIGSGTARQLKIESAQPRIVENEQGLLVGFVIHETWANGSPGKETLLADLGDIAPDSAGTARWIMTCSLSGRFADFSALVSHSDELGGELTALIKNENVHTHDLVRDVLVDLPGRDSIRDFLVEEGGVYKIFESSGVDAAVVNRSAGSSLSAGGVFGTETHYTLSTTADPGLTCLKLPDPLGGAQPLKRIVRSDGKIIKIENAWLSKTRKANPEDGWNHYVNLFDTGGTNAYTFIYEDAANLPQAPVLAFIPDRTGVETQPLSFLVEASDPNGTSPMLSAESMPVGAGLTDNGDGTAVFAWNPTEGQAGNYAVKFIASDGALTDSRNVFLTIFPMNDTDGDGMADSWELAHFGTLDRDGSGDYDNDGVPDLFEYLLGTNPTRSDHAPTIPVILSPATGVTATSCTPQLTVQNSTDADGDTITYAFEVFADEALTAPVATQEDIAEQAGTTAWTVPAPLADNARYTMRVRACDGGGCSLWAYSDFFVNTAADAPGSPRPVYPVDSTAVDTLTPVLQAGALTDPDPEQTAPSCIFEIYADDQMATLLMSGTETPAGDDAIAQWTVDAALTDQATYYWRAVAVDAQGLQTPCPLTAFTVDTTNHAPAPPAILTPMPDAEVGTLSADLTVGNSAEPDGDPLTYTFEIDIVPTFDSPARRTSSPVSPDTDTTAWHVDALSDNTTYYWRVKAHDGFADSRWARGRFFVNTRNDSPGAPVIKNPGARAWSTSLRPALRTAAAADPDADDLTYIFELYRDQALTNLAGSAEGPLPEWHLSTDLSDNARYWWRAQAVDPEGAAGPWSETAVFFVKEDDTPAVVTIAVVPDITPPPAGIKVYAYTAANAYTGLNITTDENGIATFNPEDFTGGDYRFRADYMGRQFWSETVTLPATGEIPITIPEETVSLNVATAADPAADVSVYVFSQTGSYLSVSSATDANGQVSFDLPSGSAYDFRADIMGNQYWTRNCDITAGGANLYTLDAGGGRFSITVQEDPAIPMADIRVYLFHTGGSYLNRNTLTDPAGRAAFDVPFGTYRVRADYLGYQFWSQDATIDADTAIALDIPHQDVTVTVNRMFQGTATPANGIPVYLFTESGAFQSRSGTTDTNGRAVFHLPAQAYKVRADYLRCRYWSEIFIQNPATIDIPEAEADVTVGWGAAALQGVPVYAFTTDNVYLNLNAATGADGSVGFRLPSDGAYLFRADYQAGQYWSNPTALTADTVSPVDISTGGGTFTFTVLRGPNDPLTGVNCHVFSSQGGQYFGVYGPTSSNGEVTFDLAQGAYDIRVDYLGSQFWSQTFSVPAALEGALTIPHTDIAVTVNSLYDGARTPISGVPVYLFTEGGAYQNQHIKTAADGVATFSLPDRSYRLRADYLQRQYWTSDDVQPGETIDIAMADADVTVSGGGQPRPDVPVYVFTADHAYLNLNQATDTSGTAVFRLPAGGQYDFRADYQASQYWSDTTGLIAHQTNPVSISTGGGQFAFTVLKTENEPLAGVKCYVFSQAGAYLNINAVTSSEGQAAFDLADGAYCIRMDYLGYQFWSGEYTIPETLADTFFIPHQDVVVTVESHYQTAAPLENIRVYLFTQSGAYQNRYQNTDASGQAVFSLPDKGYKVRADYMGGQFGSDPFQWTHPAVTIHHGLARVHATRNAADLPGARVYLFTATGAYMNRNADTNANGIAEFIVPAQPYQFRVDESGDQVWSPATDISAGQVTTIDVEMD